MNTGTSNGSPDAKRTITVGTGALSIADVVAVASGGAAVEISADSL